MNKQHVVAVVSPDDARREVLVRAFAAAGFGTLAAPRISELTIEQARGPAVLILDGFHPDRLQAQTTEARRRWPVADVWAVSETARLLASRQRDRAGIQHVSCEGILQRALLSLRPVDTDTLALEPSVLEAKQQCESFFDGIPDPVFIVSPALTVVRANRAFFDKVGRPPGDVIGRHCVEILHGILEPWSEYLLAKVLERPEPVRWQLPEIALGQTYHCTTFRVTIGAGQIGVAHHLRELPEPPAPGTGRPDTRRRAGLGPVALGMIHELNNPLAAVIGFADALEQTAELPAELAADLANIKHQAGRCRRIVQNLLQFSGPERPNRRPTDVNDLVRRAVSAHAYHPEFQDVQVTTRLDETVPAVLVDPDQIEQVVLNLLVNAQEAAGKGARPGRVEVATRTDGDHLVITVSDDGPGIPPADLPHIFEPLFTTAGPEEGTGLGLSISRELVRQHGGDLEAENRPEGGARLAVRLPLLRADTAPRPRDVTEARVLVIDDEALIRRLVDKMLGAKGDRVIGCATIDDALRALRERSFDIVLADFSQLEQAADQVTPLLDQQPELRDRIILTTGRFAPEEDRPERFSANPVLTKPFTATQLRRRIHDALGP
ncbi:MAG: ATP-binding protein [Planctomycetota bacterium]